MSILNPGLHLSRNAYVSSNDLLKVVICDKYITLNKLTKF